MRTDATWRTDRPRTGNTTYHRDGTVTTWNVYSQEWERGIPSDEVIASHSSEEQDRIIRHCAVAE